MINVAVTGLNAADSPAPGVPVIRCLREHPNWNGRIIALAYDALESGVLDRSIVDSVYLIPYPKAGKAALLERLVAIHQRERIDVIIPNLDAELLNFIALQPELSELGIKLFVPNEEQFKARIKANLPRFSEQNGIRTPQTSLVTNPSKLNISEKDLPIVVKGLFYEAHIAHTVQEAFNLVHKIAATWGYPVLLQKFIDGEEYNAAAVGDGTGRMVGIACMKKLVFTEKRKGWACVSIENGSLFEFSKKIVQALKWKGAIEIEAIYSKSEDTFYIIELNPRFPAWIYLAKASGANLPYTYLQLALGKPISETQSSRAGVVFSNYTTNLVTDLSSIGSLFTSGEVHYEKAV
ncbi:MAG TPA: ATP-grasp domain-containing protein [Bdellovibrionota bacterium]|nr:ATP-grasp domain-containing protein [Bdellovibrionota bacterium]